MSKTKLEQIKIFYNLPKDQQIWLERLASTHRFSNQQLKLLVDYSLDLFCWQIGSLEKFYNPDVIKKTSGKQASSKIFNQLKDGYDSIKNNIKSYPDNNKFTPLENKFPLDQIIQTDLKGSIVGKCPVASEKTRCCNLNTLDAVQQCGFDCSYCSIQSFYHGNRVRFIKNLSAHLEKLEFDKDKSIHIGTGQSSDSLMWGNRFNLLDNLSDFAKKHPNLILEMKSKSSAINYFEKNPPPPNIIFTWSLNTPKVIAAEEKGTASLYKRLESAKRLSNMGAPIGFHFHPMVWYEGWKEDYLSITADIQDLFSPDQVVMISIGTLTFIKPVIKKIRTRLAKTSILQMPLEEIAGKFSYPFEIKKELFSTLFNSFSKEWQKKVFFYMCMEDINLWEPVFNRTYESNEAFEEDMLNSYKMKIQSILQSNS